METKRTDSPEYLVAGVTIALAAGLVARSFIEPSPAAPLATGLPTIAALVILNVFEKLGVWQALAEPLIQHWAWGPKLVFRRLSPYALDGGGAVIGVEIRNVGRGFAHGVRYELAVPNVRVVSLVLVHASENSIERRREIRNVYRKRDGHQYYIEFRGNPERLRGGEYQKVFLRVDSRPDAEVGVRVSCDEQEAEDEVATRRDSRSGWNLWRQFRLASMIFTIVYLMLYA